MVIPNLTPSCPPTCNFLRVVPSTKHVPHVTFCTLFDTAAPSPDSLLSRLLLRAALETIIPSAGPPGTPVTLVGTAPWRVRGDCDQEAAGPNDESCVGEVTFGDYLCNTGAGTDDAASIISIPPGLPRYNHSHHYGVKCTLPDPSDEAEAMVRQEWPCVMMPWDDTGLVQPHESRVQLCMACVFITAVQGLRVFLGMS